MSYLGGRSRCLIILVKVWILDRRRTRDFAVFVDRIPIGKLGGCGRDELLNNGDMTCIVHSLAVGRFVIGFEDGSWLMAGESEESSSRSAGLVL